MCVCTEESRLTLNRHGSFSKDLVRITAFLDEGTTTLPKEISKKYLLVNSWSQKKKKLRVPRGHFINYTIYCKFCICLEKLSMAIGNLSCMDRMVDPSIKVKLNYEIKMSILKRWKNELLNFAIFATFLCNGVINLFFPEYYLLLAGIVNKT